MVAAAVNLRILTGNFTIDVAVNGTIVSVTVAQVAELLGLPPGPPGLPPPPTWGACPGRTRFAPPPETVGLITSNERGTEYGPDLSCEWLIDGVENSPPNSSVQVELTFTKFDTECSFDFVFVYDGLEYDPCVR